MNRGIRTTAVAAIALGAMLLAACERPPIDSVQRGYRGTGMVEMYNPRLVAGQVDRNQVPEAVPVVPTDGPTAASVYKNVPVLGNLGVAEFNRVMVAVTNWVSPVQGCLYCHDGNDLASDNVYTKVVSRRMFEMVLDINSTAKTHVGDTGVTCWTCHRGQPVPAAIWHSDPGPVTVRGPAGNRAGQNAPALAVGLTSLPYDPFGPLLGNPDAIRVQGSTALPTGHVRSIQQTEATYALMIHMSTSLGVNCTYCHNTQDFGAWEISTPQRATAWHGLRLVSQLNGKYLEPLGPSFPADKRGPLGDAPKVNCDTCHQGAYKPVYGAPMLKDYPSLAAPPAPRAAPAPTVAEPANAPNPAPTAAAPAAKGKAKT